MPTAVVTARGGGVAAEDCAERFELYDDQHTPLGVTELRSKRRSNQKRVGPGQWDLSVAEHLQPGESFREAALRGLEEELGICLDDGAAQLPQQVEEQQLPTLQGIHDYEFVESYEVRDYEGPIDYNDNEVQCVEWVALPELVRRIADSPDHFTPWLREELQSLRPPVVPANNLSQQQCAGRDTTHG